MIINEMNEELEHKSTEKGWVAMQDLLDREMPVEQKRRRFLWWWFGLLLLPFLAFGGWHLWLNPSKQPPSPGLKELPVKPQKGPLPMAQHSNPEKTDFYEHNQTTSISEQASPSTLLADNYSEKKINVKKALPSRLNYNTQTYNLSGNRDVASTSPNSAKPEPSPMDVISTLNAEGKNQDIPKETSYPAGLNSLQLPLHLVESQSVLVQTIHKNPDQPAIEKNIIPLRKASDWAFGVSIAAGMEKFTTISSWAGGLAINWQPTRRFGVRSGLLYNRYTPSASAQPVAIVPSTQFENAVDSSYYVFDFNGNISVPVTTADLLDQVIIPVAKVQMLELPLLASWQAIPRLKVFAGLNTTYVLAAQTGVESYSGQYSLKLSSSKAAFQRLNTLAARDITRWRFAAQTGFGLGLSRRLEISIFAKLPLNTSNIVQKESDTFIGSGLSAEPIASLKKRTPSFSISAAYFFRR